MNTLNQESKIENVTLAGTIDGATVKMTYSRENEKTIKQITARAEKPVENGTSLGLFVEYNAANRSVVINAYNAGIGNVPLELIEKVLFEMQVINDD